MEFDGASIRFDLDKVTDVSGMYFKICMGRGLTNATPRFTNGALGGDYGKDNSKNADVNMLGFIFTP